MLTIQFAIPRDGEPVWIGSRVSLADERWVGVRRQGRLELFDLQAPTSAVLTIPDVRAQAVQPSRLVALDHSGMLHRWEYDAGLWQEVTRYPGPRRGGPGTAAPPDLRLSPSGAYLAVTTQTSPYMYALDLLDARTGAVTAALPWGQPTFATLPSGREVLLTSGDRHAMEMVDCASGQVLQGLDEDLCTKLRRFFLVAGGTRLVAALYDGYDGELRIFDATPWLPDGQAGEPVELPLVYAWREPTQSETLLTFVPTHTEDGAISCASWVDLGYGPHDYPENETSFREDIPPEDDAIYAVLATYPRGTPAILLRRVSPLTGDLLGWSFHEVPSKTTRRAHILDDHQVLIFNERIQRFDGTRGTLTDLGLFTPPGTQWDTAATRDGRFLVLWWEE